jgi:DNA-binding NarL/FixJ family response regulator
VAAAQRSALFPFSAIAEDSQSHSLRALDEALYQHVRAVEQGIKQLVKQLPDEGLVLLAQRGIQIPGSEAPAPSLLLAGLSQEEQDIVPLICAGKTGKEIAALVGAKDERHVFYIIQKLKKHLKCTTKAEIINLFALELGTAKD